MTTRRKCLIAAAVLAGAPVIFSLHGQNAKTEPQGLVVTSSILDRAIHVLTIGLQSKSDKTIVGYSVFTTPLDAQQTPLNPNGIGYDYLDPDGSPQYIQPGQPITLKIPRIDPRVESVKVEVTAVIYLDQTAEGIGGAVLAMFDFRLSRAKEIRKSLAEQPHSPEEQVKLGKRAQFYENAAKEVK
jgi:hypothetical protein